MEKGIIIYTPLLNRASLTKGYSDSDLPMYLVLLTVKLDGSKETGQTKIKNRGWKKVFFPALVMSCGKIGEIVSFKWCVEN